jgi:hypothetical protein
MMSAIQMYSRLSFAAITLAAIGAFAPQLRAQDNNSQPPAYIDDWTHHRLVYSNPGTREEAQRQGKLEQWQKISNDPRFHLQQFKRTAGPRQLVNPAQDPDHPRFGGPRDRNIGPAPSWPKFNPDLMNKDWSTPLGSGTGAALTTGNVGTLSSGSISGTSVLTVDGVAFDASAPTTAKQTGTFTGNPAATQTVTIGGTGGTVTLTDSLSTAATQTGTFASSPLTGNAITIKDGGNTLSLTNNGTGAHATGTFSGIPSAATTISVVSGANTLSLSTNATPASAVGTVSGLPTSTTAPTITITNSVNANVLSLTTNATGAHAAGTFSGTGPTNNQTVTLQITGGSLVTFTAKTAVPGTATATFIGDPAGGDTITIGGTVYVWHGTSGGCGATANCIIHGGNTTQDAQNLEAAINNNATQCGFTNGGSCIFNDAGANASVTAAQAGAVVTVTNITAGTVAWSESSTTAITLNPAATIPAGSVSNACSSATAGTFTVNTTPATVAANFAAAINSTSCQTTFPIGVTASVAGAVVTVTDGTIGTASTLTTLGGTASNFAWSAVTAGSNGSNACGSSTAGTFATAATTALVASNISSAINLCTAATVGVTSAYVSGNTFTITSGTPGPFLAVGGSNLGTLFSWGAVSGGSAGTNTCGSSTSGTFATSASNNTLATNLAAALNACPAGAGLSAVSATNTVTVTDTTPGSFTTFTPGATNNASIFAWGGTTAGTNGTQTCPSSTTGTYVTDASTTNLATNLASAINACNTAHAAVGVTAASTGAAVTVSATTWGTAGNAITVTPASGFFAWGGGTLAGGVNGTTSATSFAVDNVIADNATNLATAINDNTATLGVTAAAAAGVVTVTASAPGTGGNSITVADTLNNFTWTAGTLASGTDGATSGTSTPPTFAYWSGSNYLTSAQVASNIATAVNARPSFSGVLSATASGTGITYTAAAGSAGNAYSVSASSFSAYTGTGTFSGGANATVQPNASPAKYGPSLTTADCTNDFVVYPTGQAGSSGSASIIAYNNIYATTCGGTVPLTYWAFNTESGANTGYAVSTSPVLSLDGTKVAFVQSNGSAAELVVVKWIASSGTLTAPTAPTVSGNISTCTAPCMTVTALSNNDTYSAPYYDYNSTDDALYVGDDVGDMEKFTGVFNGAISNATAINLGLTHPLGSPVFDPVSGCVFVGDTTGYLYSVNSGNPGTVCTSTSFSTRGHTVVLSDGGPGGGIYDAPIVDSTAGQIYAFLATNAATNTTVVANEASFSTALTGTGGAGGSFTLADVGKTITGTNIPGGTTIVAVTTTGNTTATLSQATNNFCFGGSCNNLSLTIALSSGGLNTVDQFAVSTITQGSTTATAVGTQTVGTGGDGYNLYDGTFDNVYFNSTNGASPTGSLYVVGNTGVTTGATLYRIPITNNVMGTPTTPITGLTANLANAYPWASPLTEFCNAFKGPCTVSGGATSGGGTDYIFFSVNQGTGTNCTGGAGYECILSYSVNSPASVTRVGGQSYFNPGTKGCWGTGAIVIDGDATDPTVITGASQIYFVSLNGAAAGGGTGGATTASANCTAGAAPTINAIQASQNNP